MLTVRQIEAMSHSEKINESLKLDFEEMAIWKSSNSRNTKFAIDNVKLAEIGILELSEIRKRIKAT